MQRRKLHVNGPGQVVGLGAVVLIYPRQVASMLNNALNSMPVTHRWELRFKLTCADRG